MKCLKCKTETGDDSVRCPECAAEHRTKAREYYYKKNHGKFPEGDLTRGMRSPIRDQIILLLSDGVARSSVEIATALNWKSSTSITKTLGDIKESLALRGDSRKLKKTRIGASHRLGVHWQLINRHEEN